MIGIKTIHFLFVLSLLTHGPTARAQFSRLSDEQFSSLVTAHLDGRFSEELLSLSTHQTEVEWDFGFCSNYLPPIVLSDDAPLGVEERKFELWRKFMLRRPWIPRFQMLASRIYSGAGTALSHEVALVVERIAEDSGWDVKCRMIAVHVATSTDELQVEKQLALLLMALANKELEEPSAEVREALQDIKTLVMLSESTGWVVYYANLLNALATEGHWQAELRRLASVNFRNCFGTPEGNRNDPRQLDISVIRVDGSGYKQSISVSSFDFFEGIRSNEIRTDITATLVEFLDNVADRLLSQFLHERSLYIELKPHLDLFTSRLTQFDNRFIVLEYMQSYVGLAHQLEVAEDLEIDVGLREVIRQVGYLRFSTEHVLGNVVFDHFVFFQKLESVSIDWEQTIISQLSEEHGR